MVACFTLSHELEVIHNQIQYTLDISRSIQPVYIDRFVQERRNSRAVAMELRLSYINPVYLRTTFFTIVLCVISCNIGPCYMESGQYSYFDWLFGGKSGLEMRIYEFSIWLHYRFDNYVFKR